MLDEFHQPCIKVGGTSLATIAVDQTTAANDLVNHGTNFETLATVTASNGTLVVELNDLVNGRAFADAVRVERIG